MGILSRTFKAIPSFRSTAIQNEWLSVPRAYFSSDITPVKLANNVYVSDTTDPNASPLIIMHGLFGSKQNWRGIGKALERSTKRKIYAVDARNHGESPHTVEHSSAHMSADLVHFMEKEGLQRASVMGHSMGGRTMMYFALKYRQLLEKVIIVDISPVYMPTNFDYMINIFHAMQNVKIPPDMSIMQGRAVAERQLKDAVSDKETIDFIMLNLKKTNTGEFVWAVNVDGMKANFSNFRNVQEFNMPPYTGPVLFIGGERSHFLRKEDWPKIKEIFPNAELEWLDAGHLVHFEKPAEFMKLVTDFLHS